MFLNLDNVKPGYSLKLSTGGRPIMVKVGAGQHDQNPMQLSSQVMEEIRDVLDLSERHILKVAEILRR